MDLKSLFRRLQASLSATPEPTSVDTKSLFPATPSLNLDFVESPAISAFEVLPNSLHAKILDRFNDHQKLEQDDLLKSLMEDFAEADVLSAVSALLENGFLVSDLEGHLQSTEPSLPTKESWEGLPQR